MFKLLIFLILLAGSPLFVMEVFSLDIEIQKESDRIIEAKGWIIPETHSYQEQFQIIIDQTGFKNRISIGMLSTDPNDIRLPDYIEAISSNPRIVSFTLTNKFGCIPGEIERACVSINIHRAGLGDTFPEISKNAREIADKIVADGVILFAPVFHSVTIQETTGIDGNKTLVAKVLYTTNKQPTNKLFSALANLLISGDIRSGGGFYDNAEKLSENYYSEFDVTLIPFENGVLRSVYVSLTCSDKIDVLPNCSTGNFNPIDDSHQLTIAEQVNYENVDMPVGLIEVSPLDFIQAESMSRSEIFGDEFLPLNSIIQILVFSEQNLQVKSVNSNVIEKLQHLGDIQESGWFFSSKSGNKIDGRFIFGSEQSMSSSDLAFLIGSYSEDHIGIKEVVVVEENGGGCLIATAAFGSEMSPQVQLLREIRDHTVLQTESGASFMAGFNHFYYSFSPTIADYERENPVFKEAVKLTLTPLLASLTLLQYADIDSESEMLVYGIGVILLNIGMYFVAPAVLIMKVKKMI